VTSNYISICEKEVVRLSNNVRLILNKKSLSDSDIANLNDLYNELDYYNYYKNFRKLKSKLQEDYDNE
jgi:hypothetical protein